MKIYKIHADKEKNAERLNMYYVRAKSKGQAKELFKTLVPGMHIYFIDECGIKEAEDVEGRKIAPVLGMAK